VSEISERAAADRATATEPGDDGASTFSPQRRSSLLRANVVVATGTALSRITGLLRVVVFGYVVGQGALADAYTIGNETPNIVYELLIGGVLSATLVPLFTAYVERKDDESTDVTVTVTMVALAAITFVAYLAAPLLFHLYSIEPAAGVDPDVFHHVGTLLTRVFLIQIFFYGATALATAMLNARRRFFAAAWCPILSNLVVIATLLSLPSPGSSDWQLQDVLTDDRLRWTLGIGGTAGIALMAIVLIPAIWHAGIRLHWRPSFRHPAVRRLLKLSGWTLGYVIANQVTVVVVRNLADPGSGNARAYFNAYTFFVLPHGLLAVSLATTFAPEMARSVTRRDKRSFCNQVSLGTRLVALLTLPAGVLIFVLRRAIVGALLQHGEYSAVDADAAAWALGGFALGLVGFSVYLFVLRGFYAHQDTRTPFVINVGQNALNIALAFVLVGAYDIMGLAAALAISYVVCAAWALQVMSYKVPGFPLPEIVSSLWRMAVAVAIAGEVTWLVTSHVGASAGTGAWLRIILGAIVGLVAYGVVLVVLKAPELTAARARLAGRLRTTAA
jgi:putative peptidoglycan lipid II flippase